MFDQAYPQVPNAKEECDEAKKRFQREYNVQDADIYELHNLDTIGCKREYRRIQDRLKNNK